MAQRDIPAGLNEFPDDDFESVEGDFLPAPGDPKLAALVDALFDTQIGKLRKSVLKPNQMVALARAYLFAELYKVPELTALADMLSDMTVSVNGRGLNQMVEVMSARMQNDDDSLKRLGRNLGL